jgi:hypothetical protein
MTTQEFKPTLVTLVLDESGSMSSHVGETIEAVNGYLASLKNEHPELVDVSMIKFDTRGLRRLCMSEKIDKAPALSRQNYSPEGGTPLLDAIGKCIKEIAEDGRAKLFVVQTDGEENASKEYTNATIAQLIKEKTAAGWQFIFLGADINAWSVASTIGISAGNTVSYAKHSTRAMGMSLNSVTHAYRAKGSVASHTSFADAGLSNNIGIDANDPNAVPAPSQVGGLAKTGTDDEQSEPIF